MSRSVSQTEPTITANVIPSVPGIVTVVAQHRT